MLLRAVIVLCDPRPVRLCARPGAAHGKRQNSSQLVPSAQQSPEQPRRRPGRGHHPRCATPRNAQHR
eukprot:403849-Lingulodinium_polyedra.AAC.1